MRVVARAALTAAVVAVGLGLSAAPAAACSCAGAGPAEQIELHDGGFIGTLVEVGGTTSGTLDDDRRFRFEVDQWVKGSIDADVFDVVSNGGSSQCGLSVAEGQEVAVFFTVRNGLARSGLCSTLDADAVRAHLDPPPLAPGPAGYLVTSWFDPGMWMLNGDGGLVAAFDRRTDAGRAPWASALCDDGTTVVRVFHDGVDLIDLVSGTLVERLPAVPDAASVRCDERLAVTVMGYASDGSIALFDGRTGEQLLELGSWRQAMFAGDVVVGLTGEPDHERNRLVTLARGATVAEPLHTLDLGEGNGSAAYDQVATSPDGTRVGFSVIEYPGDSEVRSAVTVLDLDTGDVVATMSADSELGSFRWLDDATVAVTSGGESRDPEVLVLDATTLETEAVLGPMALDVTARDEDGRFLGIDGANVVIIDGRATTRPTALPVEGAQLTPLPAPLAVVASGPAPVDVPVPGVTADELDPSHFSLPPLVPAEQAGTAVERSWPGWAAGMVGVVVMLGLVLAAVTLLRRLRRTSG